MDSDAAASTITSEPPLSNFHDFSAGFELSTTTELLLVLPPLLLLRTVAPDDVVLVIFDVDEEASVEQVGGPCDGPAVADRQVV